jgi:hypothetical protein
VPDNSAIWISVNPIAAGNVTTIGFSQSQLIPLNYTSLDANDDFAFELSFRPIFKVEGSLAGVIEGFSAEVFADVPKLDITVSQVQNVTRDCQAAKSNTPSQQIFHNLTLVVPSVSFDIGFNGSIFEADSPTEIVPLGHNYTLPTSCLDFLPKVSALGSVPHSSDCIKTQSHPAIIWMILIAALLSALQL